MKKRYRKLKIKNKAPNWVQKNIKYEASIHFRVLANLYNIKKDGIKSISYDKKNKIKESVKNKI
jgi:CRISPR/Cas system type I-B associated protein Csh2 (Cas7 group RAMP superfamily)